MLMNDKVEIKFLGTGDAFASGGLDNSCFHVTAGSYHLLIDCGASALISMKREKVKIEEIDAIIISHFHADHFGGVPAFILEQSFSKRKKSLTVIGPEGVEKKINSLMGLIFPSGSRFKPAFDILYKEYKSGKPFSVAENIELIAYKVKHTPLTIPHGLRLKIGNRIIAYSGDTEWTDELIPLSKDADLFICEMFSYKKEIKGHLNYKTFMEKVEDLSFKKLLFTHCGDVVLDNKDSLKFEIAEQGTSVFI